MRFFDSKKNWRWILRASSEILKRDWCVFRNVLLNLLFEIDNAPIFAVDISGQFYPLWLASRQHSSRKSYRPEGGIVQHLSAGHYPRLRGGRPTADHPGLRASGISEWSLPTKSPRRFLLGANGKRKLGEITFTFYWQGPSFRAFLTGNLNRTRLFFFLLFFFFLPHRGMFSSGILMGNVNAEIRRLFLIKAHLFRYPVSKEKGSL